MAEITLASKVKLSPDVLFQELQGDAVLLDMKSGVYFGLDGVGTRIWRLLDEHSLISSVVGAMTEEYDVQADRCGADVVNLVARLNEQGLLSVEA